MKLVIVNGIIKGDECTVSLLPEVKKELLTGDALRELSFPITVQYSYEVALLRIFNYKRAWYVATARKLNAFRSFWAAEFSFGESLQRALAPTSLEKFYDALDPALAYFVLIPLREGQRLGTMLAAPEGHLWLAATQDIKTGKMDMHPESAPAPAQLLPTVTVHSADELITHFENSDDPHLTGFMYSHSEGMTRFVTEEYMYCFKLRGNEPDIRKKYLELTKAGQEEDNAMFYQQHREALRAFDRQMKEFIDALHDKYMERYVRKVYTLHPKPIHAILRQCHTLYLQDRTQRITPAHVTNVVLSFPALFILNALQQHKQPHSQAADYEAPAGKSRLEHRASLAHVPTRTEKEVRAG